MDNYNNDNILVKTEGETENAFLFRLASLKENGSVRMTWDDIASIMNNTTEDVRAPYDESTWRKRYAKLKQTFSISQASSILGEDWIELKEKQSFFELEKQKIKLRDERNAFNRAVREDARFESLVESLKNEIKAFEKPEEKEEQEEILQSDKAYCVMVSDVHYGLSFNNAVGSYDPQIAHKRMMQYANVICREASLCHETDRCFVTLMGDMISGNIHPAIRLQNKVNLVKQVVGASQITAQFIKKLAFTFKEVNVNFVSGNHSRIDMSAEDSLREERLDDLIPWYCETKLFNLTNVKFIKNIYDSSIATFYIFGKMYVSVHGDFDNNYKDSCMKIEELTQVRPYALLGAHMHVPEFVMSNIPFIRNGCVCGSGDEYTMKKRLYGKPYQVYMKVSQNGIESVHPVNLS